MLRENDPHVIKIYNFDGKTSGIMEMTKLDRFDVTRTVLSFEHLSDHVKLVQSHFMLLFFNFTAQGSSIFFGIKGIILRLLTGC